MLPGEYLVVNISLTSVWESKGSSRIVGFIYISYLSLNGDNECTLELVGNEGIIGGSYLDILWNWLS